MPWCSINVEHVVEEIIKFFARVGVSEEIDQESDFTSQLLRELYSILYIHSIQTSPYNPQTDRLVEQFNQTLKSMLQKSTVGEGKDWDRLISYLLFAYKEVLQTLLVFSPFEYYGRNVCGPLAIYVTRDMGSK